MIQLSAEETFLLLSSRPLLTRAEDARIKRLAGDALDWGYVLWRAETYQTVPLLRAHLERTGAAAKLPDFVRSYIANWSALAAARSVEQFRELGRMLNALEEARIDYYLLKGAAIAALLYPDPLTRPMQDLDIMIHPRDAWRVQKLMYRLGYRHGAFVPRTGCFHHMYRPITARMLRHKHALHSFTGLSTIASPVAEKLVPFEWRKRQIKCAFNDGGTLVMPVFVDFHVNLSAGMELADVWRGTGARELLGQRVNVQSLTTMLWFSAARLYLEAFEHSTLKLQMFGDIDALLRKHSAEIDWAELLVMAEKYGFGAPLYYVLSQVHALGGARIPEMVLAALAPDPAEVPGPSDWGDVIPKLLSRPVVNAFALA